MGNTIGENIRRARINRGMSQVDLAKLLFYGKQAVCNWEKSRTIPKFETLLKISKILDVPIHELTKLQK